MPSRGLHSATVSTGGLPASSTVIELLDAGSFSENGAFAVAGGFVGVGGAAQVGSLRNDTAARIEAMDATLGHVPHYRGLTKRTKAGAVWTGSTCTTVFSSRRSNTMNLTLLKEFFAGFLRTRHIARHFRRLAMLETVTDASVSREVPPTLAQTLVSAANSDTGAVVINPVERVLHENQPMGMSAGTVLVRRDGSRDRRALDDLGNEVPGKFDPTVMDRDRSRCTAEPSAISVRRA